MPVRVKAVGRLVDFLHGKGKGFSWHFSNPKHSDMPDLTYDQYRDWHDECDEAYDDLVRSIDWNRVLLEAQARCLQLEHEHVFADDRIMEPGVCGESLRESMLAPDTFSRWTETPFIKPGTWVLP